MFKSIEDFSASWSQKRSPLLLVMAALIAGVIAITLLITAVSEPTILYKEF